MNDDIETRPVLLATNPFLRKKTKIVEKEDLKDVKGLLPMMFETMYKAGGIGLAAPQVGIGLRFFVIDLMQNNQPEKIVIIKTKIIEKS